MEFHSCFVFCLNIHSDLCDQCFSNITTIYMAFDLELLRITKWFISFALLNLILRTLHDNSWVKTAALIFSLKYWKKFKAERERRLAIEREKAEEEERKRKEQLAAMAMIFNGDRYVVEEFGSGELYWLMV